MDRTQILDSEEDAEEMLTVENEGGEDSVEDVATINKELVDRATNLPDRATNLPMKIILPVDADIPTIANIRPNRLKRTKNEESASETKVKPRKIKNPWEKRLRNKFND